VADGPNKNLLTSLRNSCQKMAVKIEAQADRERNRRAGHEFLVIFTATTGVARSVSLYVEGVPLTLKKE